MPVPFSAVQPDLCVRVSGVEQNPLQDLPPIEPRKEDALTVSVNSFDQDGGSQDNPFVEKNELPELSDLGSSNSEVETGLGTQATDNSFSPPDDDEFLQLQNDLEKETETVTPGVTAPQTYLQTSSSSASSEDTVDYLWLAWLLIPLLLAFVVWRLWSARRRNAAYERKTGLTAHRRKRKRRAPRPADPTSKLDSSTSEDVEGFVGEETADNSDENMADNFAAQPIPESSSDVGGVRDLDADDESDLGEIPVVQFVATPDDADANSGDTTYESIFEQHEFASTKIAVHRSGQGFARTTHQRYPAESPKPHKNPPPGTPLLLADLNSQPQDENNIDYWGIIARWKWLIFLGMAVGLGLGALYNSQAAAIYESTAHIKIEPRDPIILQIDQRNAMVPDSEQFNFRHDRTIAQYTTIERCLYANNLFVLDSFEDLAKDDVVEDVLDWLTVTPDGEDPFIYELSYLSSNPSDAQTVLNNLIETYKNDLDNQYKDESDKFIALLKDVKNQFENSFQQIQKKITDLREQNSAPAITSNGLNIHEFMLGRLSTQVEELRDELTSASTDKQRCIQALEAGEDAINETIWIMEHLNKLNTNRNRNEEVRHDFQMTDRIAQAEIALQTARMRLGTSHPTVRTLREQAEMWKQFKQATVSSVITTGEETPDVVLRRVIVALEQQIESLENSMQQTVSDFKMHQEEAERFGRVRDQLMDAERERDYIESLLTTTRNKIVEIDASESLATRGMNEGFLFTRLRDARYGKQIWPMLPVSLGVGGLLGLLCGFGLGCLIDLADKTFRNPDEIMKQLNLPLIGHIPVIGQNKRYMVENSLIDPIICTYHRPKSQASEAFRAIRTALFFSTKGTRNSVIQVTSPTPGDGKSTMAANLAVSIAQSGKRVLLVDGDMRRPRQGITFGIKSQKGFSTILTGQTRWQDAVFDCEEIEGLSVMPCGVKPNNPAELSTSPQVRDLLEELREEYDFVVIDTPPLLAVTDPCPVAARVDGVILTIRIKKNVKISAERATDILRNLGANIVGLVVNGVSGQSGYGSPYRYGAYRTGYGYKGHGYGYGYGYGYGSKYYDDSHPNRPVHKQKQELEHQSDELTQRHQELEQQLALTNDEDQQSLVTELDEVRTEMESQRRTHEHELQSLQEKIAADRLLASELADARDQLKKLDAEASQLRVALAELAKTNEQILRRLDQKSN